MKSIRADITGIGWVTTAGAGRGRVQREFGMPRGTVPDIRPELVFDRPYPNLRRMDAYSRLGLTAIGLALKDAGLDAWSEKRTIGIVSATVHGCLGADINYYETVIPDRGAHASPAVFSYTSANSFLGEAAIHFGLTGVNFVLSEEIRTGLSGISSALLHLAGGNTTGILGGFCDIGCPDLFKQRDTVSPAAVFCMLQNGGDNPRPSLGSLTLSSEGDLLLNDSPVDDLSLLVRQCLAANTLFD